MIEKRYCHSISSTCQFQAIGYICYVFLCVYMSLCIWHTTNLCWLFVFIFHTIHLKSGDALPKKICQYCAKYFISKRRRRRNDRFILKKCVCITSTRKQKHSLDFSLPQKEYVYIHKYANVSMRVWLFTFEWACGAR